MVITDRCEIAHLVQDRVADVTPFDAAAFAAAMQRLLTDRERYARYQTNCPAVMADTFSIQAVGDQLETLYQRVIAEKKAHAASR
jgi:glycosyltransferase involved in cell wall biosynthesis